MPPCLPPRRFRLSCADRAAAFFCAGAGVDGSFPDVAQGAFPPDLFPAAGAHHLRGERAVERRVPFGDDLRFQGCKIVEARQHLFPGAVGAAAAVGTRGDHRRVAVALFAPPPDLAVTGDRDLLRRQRAVLFPVPLRGKLRPLRGQIVKARQHLLSRAVGAAAPRAGPRRDGRAPAVAPFAAPPDLFLRPGQHIPRRQPAVFLRVPLLCERGIQGRKVVFPEGKLLARADRAAAPYRAVPPKEYVTSTVFQLL